MDAFANEWRYLYGARAVNVVDGDTVDLALDLGFRITWTQRFRLYGINTPELNATSLTDREVAVRAKQRVIDLLSRGAITVRTHMDKADKYGRWLAVLFVATPEGMVTVNETLVAEGLATRYMEGA